MAATKSQRLLPVKQRYDSEERSALQELAAFQRKRQEQQAQMASLKKFRADYFAKNQETQSNINIRQLLNYRHYISQINQAIDEQAQLINKIDQELEQKQRSWQRAKQRAQSLTRVIQAALDDENKLVMQREQKTMDERAARRKKGRFSGIDTAY
ncbi:MAG: flagellar export protein FliJ [Methylococcaceae bacterium]